MPQQRIRKRWMDGSKRTTFSDFVAAMTKNASAQVAFLLWTQGTTKAQAEQIFKNSKHYNAMVDQIRYVWRLITDKGYSLVLVQNVGGYDMSLIGKILSGEGESITIERLLVLWSPTLFKGDPLFEQMLDLLRKLETQDIHILQLLEHPGTTTLADGRTFRVLETETIPKGNITAIYEKV